MKTKIAAIVIVVLGIVAVVLYSSVYVVKEGKLAIVTQFGKPVTIAIQVKLSQLGDGIESGHVLKILVDKGDWIKENQGIVELETNKVILEVPSSHAGRVTEIQVSAGDSVAVGDALITVEFLDEKLQKAGLHFKLPFIQEAHYLEKRLLPWDGEPESVTTNDKKAIDIDVWARWRIVDLLKFFVKVQTEQQGQKFLDDLVNSAVKDVVARHKLIDVVRRSNKELEYESEELERIAPEKVEGKGRDDVEEEILHRVDLTEFGMELTMVRIKRVNYVASVRKDVYDRMISERLQIARLYDSEAQEERNKILGQTQKDLDQIEGEMEQESAKIRGEADARVIKMTAEAYGGEALEFYEFLRRLEVFKKSLGRETRLIMSTDSDLFRLLKEPGEPAPRPDSPSVTSP